MREERSNDVTIFRSSRYLYVGAGLVVFFKIVCREFFRSSLLRVNSSKFFSLNFDIAIGIYKHCAIAYLKRATVFCDIVSSVEIAAAVVEIWQYVRTSYGADILPIKRACTFLDKTNIITIITIIVVVDTDFFLRK